MPIVLRFTVVEWISNKDASAKEQAVGGLGGWFGYKENRDGEKLVDADHRWKDYVEIWRPEVRPYLEAIRASVIAKGLRLTGEQHQSDEKGVPLFGDGKVATFFIPWLGRPDGCYLVRSRGQRLRLHGFLHVARTQCSLCNSYSDNLPVAPCIFSIAPSNRRASSESLIRHLVQNCFNEFKLQFVEDFPLLRAKSKAVRRHGPYPLASMSRPQ